MEAGAGCTFITSKTFKRIPYQIRPGLKPTKRMFAAANGELLQCDGHTVILMEFKGTELYFPVIVGGVTQHLLGEDFIKHFKCNFDHGINTFVIHGGGSPYPKKHERAKRLARVVATETVVIPAGNEYILPVKFKDKPLQ